MVQVLPEHMSLLKHQLLSYYKEKTVQEYNITINKGLTFNETVEIQNDLGVAEDFKVSN